jgi:hypothetical protein
VALELSSDLVYMRPSWYLTCHISGRIASFDALRFRKKVIHCTFSDHPPHFCLNCFRDTAAFITITSKPLLPRTTAYDLLSLFGMSMALSSIQDLDIIHSRNPSFQTTDNSYLLPNEYAIPLFSYSLFILTILGHMVCHFTFPLVDKSLQHQEQNRLNK